MTIILFLLNEEFAVLQYFKRILQRTFSAVRSDVNPESPTVKLLSCQSPPGDANKRV